MAWRTEGWPLPWPTQAVPLVYSNENIGFTANLVTGTNDVFQFAMPLPGSIDKFRETMVIHACDYLFLNEIGNPGLGPNSLQVTMSMLAKDFDGAFRGTGVDAEDETMKSQFDGPYNFGALEHILVTTAATEPGRVQDNTVNLRWIPPRPIDLSIPFYNNFINTSKLITLITSAAADASFTQFEKIMVRPWVTFRRLSRMERRARMALDLARIHT